MNRVLLLTAGICLALFGRAQTDTTGKNTGTGTDTLRVGSLLIVRDGGPDSSWNDSYSHRRYHDHHYRPSNVTTEWCIVDLGLTNFNDMTDYSSSATQQFAPGSNKDWFRLHNLKSVDVNIWIFMQKINLVKHVVNLKYGLGVELNNYRYEYDIRYLKNPTEVIMDTIHYHKNKLAEDFVTLPVMLNFNFTPHRRHPFGLSAGVSFGYRYSSRQKFVSGAYGKQKTYNDFDLNSWKLSYIGELNLGPVVLYGSYATRSIFSDGLNQVPYAVGVRIGNW
ncbi:MAG TPA: outer membrane beta-barrel protein [Puia sp.]|nr:outer membrane beta-barrel protein [Puia sp.]